MPRKLTTAEASLASINEFKWSVLVVYLTYVRSTGIDDSWQWLVLGIGGLAFFFVKLQEGVPSGFAAWAAFVLLWLFGLIILTVSVLTGVAPPT